MSIGSGVEEVSIPPLMSGKFQQRVESYFLDDANDSDLNPTTDVWEIPTKSAGCSYRNHRKGLNPTTDVWEIPTRRWITILSLRKPQVSIPPLMSGKFQRLTVIGQDELAAVRLNPTTDVWEIPTYWSR